MKHCIVVLNASSGHNDKADAEARIRAVLTERNVSFEILRPAPADMRETLRTACRRYGEPGVVFAAGGDGTLNVVAQAAIDVGWTLGVLPLGTFNYFARDLGLPLDAEEALRAALDGEVRRVHTGRINGELFLNNASFGLYRQLLEQRERMKQRLGRYRIVAVMAALHTMLRFDRSYRLELEIDGRRETVRTPLLFIGLNSLQLENLELDIAGCAAAGRLAVIATRTASRWRLFWLALLGAFRRLQTAPELHCLCASRLTIQWPGHTKARVAVDGETIDSAVPLVVEAQPSSLPVLVPRRPEPRA